MRLPAADRLQERDLEAVIETGFEEVKMAECSGIREFAHELVERMNPERLQALLLLLDEDFFSAEEIAEIKQLSDSDEWTDWREIRGDL
jgi:hypothetical protein